ncbi:MAG: hypothetical protein V4596_01305 [Bdellovibrionota bacterium]
MLSNEGFFRLFSVGILGVLFVSITALANKEQSKLPTNLFTGIEHIEEAEMINNNEMHALNLTSVGERIEIVNPPKNKK